MTDEPSNNEISETETLQSDLVWAINVGGDAYRATDGTIYQAESDVIGGTIGVLDVIKGSQEAKLYQTYREGDISISKTLENGIYDVTFHFVEPLDIVAKERQFNVIVQGQKRITNLDVMLARDGKVKSGLSVAVPNVNVSNNKLDITFEAIKMKPVLSAVVVRNKQRQTENWHLVWGDEFDYEGEPDPSKWTPEVWQPGKVNDEDQYYTNRAKNIRVENGHLVIEAHREDYKGAKYTSGRLQSSGKGDFLYGRFEIRAKLPFGQGTWPAVWMLPSNPYHYSTTCEIGEDWQGSETCDAWPNSGEIDILEHVGYEMGHIHGTVHTKAYYWVKWEQRKGRVLFDDVHEKFHVYSIEWSPERIDMFVDDTHYFTYMNEGTGWKTWPFDQPFHLILNIAMGGVWGGSGGATDDSVLPQQMLIDYVRVYQQG